MRATSERITLRSTISLTECTPIRGSDGCEIWTSLFVMGFGSRLMLGTATHVKNGSTYISKAHFQFGKSSRCLNTKCIEFVFLSMQI